MAEEPVTIRETGPGDPGTAAAEAPPAAGARDLVPFRQAVATWFAISLQTFGGPAGQIAVMQRILVDEKRWIGQQRFLHALNYCMLLPGPEAQQLAVYIGWLLNGVRGGLVAGVLFVIPGVVALLALSAIYVAYGSTTAVTAPYVERLRGSKNLSAALTGITAAVVGVIANLALYFALHTLFAETTTSSWGPVELELPDPGTLRPVPLVIAIAAAVMIFRLRWSVLRTLGACALLGLGAAAISLPLG
jgi:chromate transporter